MIYRMISKDELTKILADHGTWRSSGGKSGARADLTRADLARANLTDANLTGADLTGADLTDANLTGANLTGADLTDANLTDADLTDANLTRANLARADLIRANLTDANLARAYLARANLAGANLTGADLTGADLTDANLTDADLTDANLTGANLTGADLTDADLTDANLTGADLTDADLTDANLTDARNVPAISPSDAPAPPPQTHEEWRAARPKNDAERAKRYRERHPDVPVVEQLDAKILTAIEGGSGKLEMGNWHSCSTTHCRAGWAIHLAGDAGYELERRFDPAVAGRMIYSASTGRVPHFYATNEVALDDIKRCAAEQLGTPTGGTRP